MTMKALFAVLAVVAGVATALQASANAGLSQRAGLAPALVLNTVIVLAGTLVFFVAHGPHANAFPVGIP